MSEIPSALRSALERRQTNRSQNRPPVALQSGRVARGDLRMIRALAHDPADPRLGLVLSVDSDNDFAEVLLAHTAPEMASETDGILPEHLTSAAYDIVIQTDLRGVVWTVQLAGAVGHIDEDGIRALRHITREGEEEAEEQGAKPTPQTGLRLAGPSDARWAFKEAEGKALRRLTRDCTQALLDQGTVWTANPGLLQPELLDRAHDREGLLLELLHWVGTRTVTVSFADVELLLELGVLDLTAWSDLGDLGFDVWMGLQEMVERAATASIATGSDRPVGRRMVSATHLESSTEVTESEVIHYLGLREATAP